MPSQLAHSSLSVHPATPIDGTSVRRKVWNDAPLRTKVALLVLTAIVGTTVVVLLHAMLGLHLLILWVALIVWTGVLLGLGVTWVCQPVDHLVHTCDLVCREPRPHVLQELPITRTDEIGQLARGIYRVATVAIRDSYDAKQLRRTLDHRVAAAIRAATAQLHQLAMRDPLTDLANRRFLEEHLEPLVKSIRESDTELACLVMDLDDFKSVNDTLGHARGDELLVFVASLLSASIRRDDYAVRLGGDEFMLLMPNCDAQRVEQLVDQWRLLLAQHTAKAMGGKVHTGLSIGLAMLRRDGWETGTALMDAADANLYAAKRAGKNRLVGLAGRP